MPEELEEFIPELTSERQNGSHRGRRVFSESLVNFKRAILGAGFVGMSVGAGAAAVEVTRAVNLLPSDPYNVLFPVFFVTLTGLLEFAQRRRIFS